jgi:hypothetical protein
MFALQRVPQAECGCGLRSPRRCADSFHGEDAVCDRSELGDDTEREVTEVQSWKRATPR